MQPLITVMISKHITNNDSKCDYCQKKLSVVATMCTGSEVSGPFHHEGTWSCGESQCIKDELFELDAVVAGRFDWDTILVCHRDLFVRHMKTTRARMTRGQEKSNDEFEVRANVRCKKKLGDTSRIANKIIS